MSAVAANPSLLHNLKALCDEGHLSAQELAREKAKLFTTPVAPAVGQPTAIESMLTGVLATVAETQADMARAWVAHKEQCARTMDRGTCSTKVSTERYPTTPSGNDTEAFSHASKRPRPSAQERPPDQPSLFEMGVTPLPKKAKKHRRLAVVGHLKCPYCSFVTTKPGPLALHQKYNHSSKTSTNLQSVASMFIRVMSPEERAKTTDRCDVHVDVDAPALTLMWPTGNEIVHAMWTSHSSSAISSRQQWRSEDDHPGSIKMGASAIKVSQIEGVDLMHSRSRSSRTTRGTASNCPTIDIMWPRSSPTCTTSPRTK